MSPLLAVLLLLAAGPSIPPDVQHKPVERALRGDSVLIKLSAPGVSETFSPLVHARPGNKGRYLSYPLTSRGRNEWVARLPPSSTSQGQFSYFIEFRADGGERRFVGDETSPFQVPVDEPLILPAKVLVSSERGAKRRSRSSSSPARPSR